MDTVCILVSLRDAAPVKYLNAWPCWPQPWAIEPSTPDFGLVFSHGVSYRQGKSWHGTLGTKKGFCAASHLQCDRIFKKDSCLILIHDLILCSTIGGKLAEERIRRSDLASDDSQAFRKSWQDGETARRQDSKQPWNMWVTWAICITWVTWHESESHEITRSRACVFRCHSRSQQPVWSDLLGCLALAANVVSCSVSCSVSLRFLEISWDPWAEVWIPNRFHSGMPMPWQSADFLRVHQSPSESIRVYESWWNESPSPVTCRTLAVSVVFQYRHIVIFGWQHTLWYTLWSFVKWICFKMLQISSCQDESWGASSGWATSKDWWWCSLAASYKRFRRYMKISNL